MSEIKQALLFLMAAGGLSVIVALLVALWRAGPPPFYYFSWKISVDLERIKSSPLANRRQGRASLLKGGDR